MTSLRARAGSWWLVAATVALAAVWPLTVLLRDGAPDELLGAGELGPSRARIEADIPDLAPLPEIGHDGQQFYVIARHPFDPVAAAPHLDEAAYRYTRILYPVLASLLAPGGGRPLILAFAVVTLLGVALAARALQQLPGGPWWLPLTVAVMPTTLLSLTLTVADALAMGLALAAVAAATGRRWAWTTAFLVLAVLTRESSMLVAAGLACTPAMPNRWRLTVLAVPGAALAAWTWWVAAQLGTSPLDRGSDQLAVPFTGWLAADAGTMSLVGSGLALVLLVLGAWRARHRFPHVAVVLALQALLLVSLSELVAFSWMNSLRTATSLLPLAVWALTSASRPASRAA